MPKTIYLANPYGFSAQQKAELLPTLGSALEGLGLEVWEPFVRNNQVDFAEAGGHIASGKPTSAKMTEVVCWAGGDGGLSENPAITKR